MSLNSTSTSTANPAPPADPFNQTFTLLYPDGTPFNVSITDLDAWYIYSIYVSIEYASQLGASLLLLVVLLLLSNPSKRLQPLFLINASALLLNFLRLLLSCLYFTGPFSEAYAYLAMDFTRVGPSATGVSLSAELLTVLVLILIQLSLLLQAHVVCLTLRRTYKLGLLTISSLLASTTIAWRLYLAVVNIQLTLNFSDPGDTLPYIEAITNFVTTASIFWFSALFVAKLAHALHRRRKLGLRSWGSMQIIFTMGCQTLVVPALFSALQYLVDFPAVASFVLTLVAIFLPLSSLWAGASVEGTAGFGNPLGTWAEKGASPRNARFRGQRFPVKPIPKGGGPESASSRTASWYSPATERFPGSVGIGV